MGWSFGAAPSLLLLPMPRRPKHLPFQKRMPGVEFACTDPLAYQRTVGRLNKDNTGASFLKRSRSLN